MKLIYWISTGLLSFYLLWSAYSYLFMKSVMEGVRQLGFPDYFRVQLAVLKVLAVVIILIPGIPTPVKEWAYAGIGLFLITAMVAHFAHKDPVIINMINLVFMALLITSYLYFKKIAL